MRTTGPRVRSMTIHAIYNQMFRYGQEINYQQSMPVNRAPADYAGSMPVIAGSDIELTPNYSVQDMLLRLPSLRGRGTQCGSRFAGRPGR